MEQRYVFTVYQITLTNAEVAIINREGHHAVPKHKASLDITTTQRGDQGATAGLAWLAGHYTEAAKLVATDLEGVFEIGNCGPETSIARTAPMHSVSVGDIVEGPDGLHVVASFGFKPVLFGLLRDQLPSRRAV